MENNIPELRPLQHLATLTTRYPSAWQQFDDARAERGKSLPDWPEWCFVPLAGAYAVVSGGGENRVSLERTGDIAALGALGAWRMTKGIYRFDSDIFTELWDTPLTGELPSELLLRLPEWCGYIEVGRQVMDAHLYGFYAHLEHDANDGHRELRLLLDYDSGLSPLPVHLVGTLEQGLEAMVHEGELQLAQLGRDINALRAQYAEQYAEMRRWGREAAPLISLLLYLCSERPDIGGKGQPGNPQPKRVKGGTKLFAQNGVREWEVAYRLGAAFRRARAEGDGEGTDGRQRPRAFVRRAHWHTYLTGKGRTERVLKWLSPVLVNFEAGELPATVKRVN